jgi:hypothetical protein
LGLFRIITSTDYRCHAPISTQLPTEDILWVTQEDIICKIKDPKPSAKSARLYRLEREDLAKIEQLYSK